MESAIAFTDVSAGYGATVVLERFSLSVEQGALVAILGRNGVGKTTLFRTIMGHTDMHGGAMTVAGSLVSNMRAYSRSRMGIGWVPQDRQVFPSLTVIENLQIAERPGKWTVAGVMDMFPSLANRRSNFGNQLSGGEQQMLSIARALVGNPRLLLLDEPLEGLAPAVAETILNGIRELRRDDKMTILVVEQHLSVALELAPRSIVLDRGRIVYDGPSASLLENEERLNTLMGSAGCAH